MHSAYLYDMTQDRALQGRILVLSVAHAQRIMNLRDDPKDVNLARLKARAVELLNGPDQFRERLALSVVVQIPDEAFDPGLSRVSSAIDDEDLILAIPDAFDALAGVSPD